MGIFSEELIGGVGWGGTGLQIHCMYVTVRTWYDVMHG